MASDRAEEGDLGDVQGDVGVENSTHDLVRRYVAPPCAQRGTDRDELARVMEKLLLTAEEAGEVLSLSRTTVYDLMARGLLESVVVGRSRRIPSEALAAFVQVLRQGLGGPGHPSARMEEG